MPVEALLYIDKHYSSILFRGFFHQHEEKDLHGWVYWLPQYINTRTSLKVYFISVENELLELDKEGNIQRVDPDSTGKIDIFFGRTLGSFDPDNPLIAAASLKILYPVGNSIPESFRKHKLSIIQDTDFIKPIPEQERRFFYSDNTRREPLLLYPAALHNRKGQLKFAQRVSPRALKGKKVLFCGTVKSERYAQECFDILRRKKIDFEYLPKVRKQELGDLYRRSSMTLILSRNDWNPRTFYESMACGTPSILSQNVKLAGSVEPYAFRASKLMLNRSLRKSLGYPEKLHRVLAEKSLGISEEDCYEQLFAAVLNAAPDIPMNTHNKSWR